MSCLFCQSTLEGTDYYHHLKQCKNFIYNCDNLKNYLYGESILSNNYNYVYKFECIAVLAALIRLPDINNLSFQHKLLLNYSYIYIMTHLMDQKYINDRFIQVYFERIQEMYIYLDILELKNLTNRIKQYMHGYTGRINDLYKQKKLMMIYINY